MRPNTPEEHREARDMAIFLAGVLFTLLLTLAFRYIGALGVAGLGLVGYAALMVWHYPRGPR